MSNIISSLRGLRAAKALFSLLVLCTALLCGCSSNPSASEGEKIVREQITQNSKSCINLVSFSKVNGQEGKMLGVDVYRMDWKVEIEFLADCGWSGGFTASPGKPVTSGLEFFTAQNMGKVLARKGERKTIIGRFNFEKTEKGWKVYDSAM